MSGSRFSRKLESYVYNIAGDDPRYKSFLLAQGFAEAQEKKNSMLELLMSEHGDRINSYQVYWDLYLNHHWFSVSEENISKVKANYSAFNVNRHVSFLMNKGFLVESDFPAIEKYLQDNWARNKGGMDKINLFGWTWALQTSVAGDSWIRITRNEEDGKYFKYDLLNSMGCFPVYDRGKQKGFLYYAPEKILTKENYGFSEYDNRWEGYYLTPGAMVPIIEEKAYKTEQNDYLKIPVVHTRNFPLPISPYGLSDMINYSDLNLLLDRVLTDLQDIVDYQGSPVTIITGAKAGDLQRGANKVWSLMNKDAKIGNLELAGDLAAISKHTERIRDLIGDMANNPANKLDNISNTSAAALAITFMPLYETMELKRILFGESILDLNTKTIEMALMAGDISASKIIKDAISSWEKSFSAESDEIKNKFYPFSEKLDATENFDLRAIKDLPKEIFQTYVTWFPPLPRDEKTSADLAIAMVNAGLWSKRYARAYTGMAEKESVVMDKEVGDDIEDQTEKGVVTVTNSSKVKKTGLEGDNDVKGEKESKRVENEA